MKHYIVNCHVGYAGMDAYEPLSLEDDHTELELEEQSWVMTVQHAASYGYYPMCDFDDYGYLDTDEIPDCYIESISAHAEVYDPKKHDRKRAGGGSFKTDFEFLDK